MFSSNLGFLGHFSFSAHVDVLFIGVTKLPPLLIGVLNDVCVCLVGVLKVEVLFEKLDFSGNLRKVDLQATSKMM